MSASGCCLKMCCQFDLEVGDLPVQLGDEADRGAGVVANAAATVAGAVRCSACSAVWMSRARVSRPALPTSPFEGGSDRRQGRVRGLGGSRGASEYGQRVAVMQVVEHLRRGRVVLRAAPIAALGLFVRPRIRFWCPLARTLIASASGLSPAIGRWLCRFVRTRSASSFASPASEFATETWCRSR